MDDIINWIKRIFSIQTIGVVATIIGTYYGYKTYILNANSSTDTNTQAVVKDNSKNSLKNDANSEINNKKANEASTEEELISLANQGNLIAQLKLAIKYYETDWSKSKKWFRMAAEQGNVDSQGILGRIYQIERNYSEAFKWFKKGADNGDISCIYEIGMMYKKGEFVNQNAVEAEKWLRLAAEKGYIDAEVELKELE